MNKMAKLLLAAGIAAGSVVGFAAGTASAHHGVITASAVCTETGWDATFTAVSPESWGKSQWKANTAGWSPTGYVTWDTPLIKVTHQTLGTASASSGVLSATWKSPEVNGQAPSASVNRPADCTAKPETKVEYGEWQDGTFECGDTTVEQTRTVTTTTYVIGEGSTWVAEAPVVAQETRNRDLTADEQYPCPTTPPTTTEPPPVTTTPPPVTTTPPPVVTVPPTVPPTVATDIPPVPVPVVVPTGGLPATGANTGWIVGIALILIAAGALALATVRRKR